MLLYIEKYVGTMLRTSASEFVTTTTPLSVQSRLANSLKTLRKLSDSVCIYKK